jgi:cell wall-associated NlpC family hydrolase
MVLAAVLGGCASTPPAAPAPAPQARAQDPEPLIQALAALGVDYRYGGKSYDNGFDCSGLVAHVYREAYGVELPHNSLAQSRRGKPVKRDALQMGDLVFYNTQQQPFSHVGIYMGDGRFIHAPKTGAAVRMEKMSSTYWTRRYDGARRIAY